MTSIEDIPCERCGNLIARRDGDRIIVRWKGRTVQFTKGTITCELCATDHFLDKEPAKGVA